MSDPVERLADELFYITDPRRRLELLAKRIAEIDEAQRRQAVRLLNLRAAELAQARNTEPVLTWREIGEIFGVSAQRAEAMSKQHTITTQRGEHTR